MANLIVAYPGLERPISLRYTAQHGFIPGVIEIQCGPQLNLPAIIGQVFFTDGSIDITLRDCKLDSAGIQITTNGHIERIRLLDRRWRWHRFGEISGTYNIRNPDNSIVDGTEKSPQQMATLCFEALGEQNFDVSALPNDPDDRPFVNWECATPQYVLDWLCNRSGCDLAPDWNADQMRIVRLGEGDLLPIGWVQTVEFGLDTGEIPDSIKICAGYELHQNKLKLEAVGLEEDGTWNNRENLSYGSSLENIADPKDPIPDANDATRALAKTYLTHYRVKNFASDSLELPWTGETLDSVNAILPVRRHTAEGYTLPDGTQHDNDAFVSGIFAVGILDEPESLQNTFDEDELLEGTDWSLDGETGILSFPISNPVFKIRDDEDGYEAAELYLTTSHYVKDEREDGTYQYRRYTRERQIGNFGTPPYVVRRDDVIARYISEWQLRRLADVTNNLTEINQILDAHLNALQAEFSTNGTNGAQYGVLAPIRLDGAIRQVTWRISCHGPQRGAHTWAYRNVEFEPGIPRRRERSRIVREEHQQRILQEDARRNRRDIDRGDRSL